MRSSPTSMRPSGLLALAVMLAAVPSAAQTVGGTPGATPTSTNPSDNPNISTVATPATSGDQAQGVNATTPSIQTVLGPYGDPGGVRAFLEKKGITYNFTYIGEVLGNPTGGYKQGATYEGRLDGELDIDLEKLNILKNAALHANFYQIHGRGLTGNNLLDLFTVSGIEAYPSTKLYEAWYEQKLDDGKLFFRAGQLAADTEFFISQTATLFVSSTFGWPAIYANDLPSGGPAYPLATPGLRFKYLVNDNITVLAALFNGDPAGPYQPGANAFLPQIRDLNGTLFRVEDRPLLITEAQFTYNQGKDAAGLPGTVKIGYLHHFGDFTNFDAPTNVGVGLGSGTVAPGALSSAQSLVASIQSDDSIYGIIDQTVYQVPGHPDQGAAVFVRAAAAPSDRNLIDVYVDTGIAYKGLLKGRPDDTVGLAAAYGRIGAGAQNQDYQTGGPLIRDFQALVELTYQYVVLPGVSVQPDFQYVFHPGAHGVADPVTGQPIKDAAVFGLRATVHY